MEILIVSLVSLVASGLTFFSGFGLGTILMPVFALFFPLETAIAATALVHLLNNIFKLVLTYKSADLRVVFRFGVPALLSAFAGAYLLSKLSHLNIIASYSLFGKNFGISPVKLVIAFLLLFFSLMDLLPAFRKIQFDSKYLVAGGVLSGFFGGLSGNQGALRSAFLIRAGLSKEAFIASGVLIACMIDVSRLVVYSGKFESLYRADMSELLIVASLSAFTGAYLGKHLVQKVTLKSVQLVVALFLMMFSTGLALGWI
ncbi:MAG TPA: sulfite exporter TauE/SafE family protein [Bacteroidia bacterium]|nr:sulfite exporter TauE/SafE family protein [Bacteroidia bacterium]